MGNILRLLARDGDSCCALPKTDVFVDFENAQPSTEEETAIFDEAEQVLQESKSVLQDLMAYTGATREIREAIGNPSPNSELAAWEALIPLVKKLKGFYLFSQRLNQVVPKILGHLCNNGEENISTAHNLGEQLDEKQALVRQFAKVLEFILKFDEYKMLNPALQNDFSYYRRTTQRSRHSELQSNGINYDDIEIPTDMANWMSLFFAHATPMLNALSEATKQFAKQDNQSSLQYLTEMLSAMAKVCQKMLELPELKSRIKSDETELFVLRVMVALIILYDHVHPNGAFNKGSSVDVKGCVKVVREQEKSRAESLLNALRYTTMHLNDESTPKNIKSLLFDELS